MTENLEPVDRYLDEKKAKRRHRVRRYMTRPVMSTYLKTEVLGEENVKGLEGAFILVPNHSSHLDAPMVFSLLPDWITEKLATGAAADYFYRKRGISSVPILVFPEGTRSRSGKIGQPKAGAAALAMQVGVPIVPIAMLGGHEAMPVGRFLPKFRSEVCLFIGRPMKGREGESAEAYMARVFHAIELMLEQHTPHPVDEDGTSPFGEFDDAA